MAAAGWVSSALERPPLCALIALILGSTNNTRINKHKYSHSWPGEGCRDLGENAEQQSRGAGKRHLSALVSLLCADDFGQRNIESSELEYLNI